MNFEVAEFLEKIFLIQVLAGGRSRIGEPWVAGPSSYPLDHEVLVKTTKFLYNIIIIIIIIIAILTIISTAINNNNNYKKKNNSIFIHGWNTTYGKLDSKIIHLNKGYFTDVWAQHITAMCT
jgi:hypothetical protein